MSRLIASAAAVCVVTLALALSRAQSPNAVRQLKVGRSGSQFFDLWLWQDYV